MKYVTLEHRQSLPYGVIGCTYTRFDTNDNSFENVAAFVISIVCGVFLTTGLYLSYTFTVNEGLNRPLTENFSFTKTGGQIVIEPKHPNVLRGFFQPNNVINITSETFRGKSTVPFRLVT